MARDYACRIIAVALFLAAASPSLALAAEVYAEAEAVELPEVRVAAHAEEAEGSVANGYRYREASVGPLGAMPLREIPYSLNVTSGELLRSRGAHTVSEALKTNPTVATLMESGTYTSMSRVMIRGFTAADQSDMRDGLVDRSFTFVPLENVDRIEVLNGFSSFMQGFAALGGSVNYVSKTPTATPLRELTAAWHGGGLGSVHGDFGGPIDEEGRWGYRVNVYGEDGRTFIDDSRQWRGLASARLEFKPSPDTRWWLDLWRQKLKMRGLQTYINIDPAGGIGVPDASHFDVTKQYGQDWTYNEAAKNLVGIGVESRLNEVFSVRAGGRFGEMWRDYLYVGATLTDHAGNYREQATGSTRQRERTRSAQALVDADFHTGPLTHKLTFGYTGTYFSYSRGDDVRATLGLSNIHATVDYANPDFAIGSTNYWTRSWYDNWLIGDRIAFGEHWSAIVGVNRASLRQRSHGVGTALAVSNYTQRRNTPTYALLFKPTPKLTAYVSYMEGLANGGAAPASAANANEMLSPSVSRQYEAGLKGAAGGVDWTLAVFRIDKVNEYLDPRDNTYRQDGRQLHDGVELSATGKIAPRLTAIGGLTVLDARVKRARNNPAIEGKTPVNVPERQARLYLEYLVPGLDGLTLIAGGQYSGARPVDAANRDEFDGATVFDLGARYRVKFAGQELTARLTVANVFDKAYWSYYRAGDGLLLGAPRTVSLSVSTQW